MKEVRQEPNKAAGKHDDIHAEALKQYERGFNRDRKNMDEAYFDLRFAAEDFAQWDEKAYAARTGQGRPIITVNKVPQFVRQVTGDMRQMRPAIKCVPADDRAQAHVAEKILPGMIRYIENRSDAQGAYFNAADAQVIGGIDTYMTQNIQTHTVGPLGGTPLVNGAGQNVNYSPSVKNTEYVPGTQTLNTDGWTNSAASRVKQGDVFTIAGVFAVNPVTKLPFLRQFVVTADMSSDGAGVINNMPIAPAIITTGAFQNVSAAPADNAALTFLGTAATGYAQNLVFHKNAFGLVVVPMEKPPGAVDVARESYKGLSVRVVPYYDGANDVSKWRLDVLYGIKTLDPRLAVRLSGT